MMKKAKLLDLLSLIVVAVIVLFSIYFHYQLPDYIINHWNAAGQADGYGKRDSFLWLMSLFSIGLYLLFKYLPKIDPKKRNYAEFDSVYNIFKLAMFLFFAVVFFVTVFINMGHLLPINRIMSWLVGLLFLIMGTMMKNIKQNWFMGIKTPWTLSNEVVWDKTHIFGGRVFMASGVLMVIFSYLPARYFIYYFLPLIIFMVFGTFAYSYWQYKKIGDNQN